MQQEQNRIIGAIQEFQRSSEKEFGKIESRLDRLDARLSGLEGFKIKVVGSVTAIVAVIQAVAWFITTRGD